MSDWKKIEKSSYNLSVGKYSEWVPSHPFTIPYQGPKIRYSEGDEITDVTDPSFDIDFTGQPLSDQHFPCGYWHKNYIPPQQVIYTSLLYPVEVFESAQYDVNVIAGEFYIGFKLLTYEYIESLDLNVDVISGIFKSTLLSYGYAEELDIGVSLNAGNFRKAILSYTYSESLDYTLNVNSGSFRMGIIQYTYWPHEDLDLSLTLIAGYHNA